MARMARLVVPDYPHHVTQRGNRRQQVFFNDDDYQAYIDVLSASSRRANVEIWAYCLMPNHVHVVATPKDESSLCDCFSDAHRQYTRRINFREGWRGYLWQGRFHSYVMDEAYLLATVRYVELNPLRAGLCQRAVDWRWSSAKAHASGQSDGLVVVDPMLERIDDWAAYLNEPIEQQKIRAIRAHSRTGRPLGSDTFLDSIQTITGRDVRKRKPGRSLKIVKLRVPRIRKIVKLRVPRIRSEFVSPEFSPEFQRQRCLSAKALFLVAVIKWFVGNR